MGIHLDKIVILDEHKQKYYANGEKNVVCGCVAFVETKRLYRF